tara:strand:+ start:896 stop:1108 length:213 start_codon:yes stop_codon:yes gene_type:complete
LERKKNKRIKKNLEKKKIKNKNDHRTVSCVRNTVVHKVNPVEQKKKRKKIEQNNKKRSNEQKDQTMASTQ